MPTLKVVFLPLLQLGCEHNGKGSANQMPPFCVLLLFFKSDAHNSRKLKHWRIYFSKRAHSDIQCPEASRKQSKQKWRSGSQAMEFGGNCIFPELDLRVIFHSGTTYPPPSLFFSLIMQPLSWQRAKGFPC